MFRSPVLVSVLACVLGASGCANTSWSEATLWSKAAIQMNVELTERQLPSSFNDQAEKGTVPAGAQWQPVILLRADSPRAGALVVSNGYSVESGEVVLSDSMDVQVRFGDGRAWISVGNKIPYVDGEGRVFLLEPEQVFGMPQEGGDLVRDRISLDEVLGNEDAFTPGP